MPISSSVGFLSYNSATSEPGRLEYDFFLNRGGSF